MRKITNLDRLRIKIKMLFIPDGPSGDRKRRKLYEPYLKNMEDFKRKYDVEE
jgi:hypothetical protein